MNALLQICHKINLILMKSNGYMQKRWGIETSFRELKYALGLTRFHSKKPEYIMQEIWSRMTLYNFCEIIATNVVINEKKRTVNIHISSTIPEQFGFAVTFYRLKKKKLHPM